jgi:hypothetical protein
MSLSSFGIWKYRNQPTIDTWYCSKKVICLNTPSSSFPPRMARTDTLIIKAWQRLDAREDDEAYEGRIDLGPPNHDATAVKRKESRAAAAIAL